MSTKQKIFKAFENGTLACKNLSEICTTLDIPYREKKRLLGVLEELIKEGKIYENDGGRYGTSEQLGLIKGEIVGNERGFAFLMPDDKDAYERDFFIPKKFLQGALHGDKVLAEKLPVSFGEREEAAVVKILSRGYEKIVGTFRRDRRAGYLLPDEKKFSTEIYIPLSACERIKSGVKAVAKITSYPFGRAPGGEIVEVLGDEDDFFAEELSIIRSYDLKEEFPPIVEKEAKKQEERGICAPDLENRRDFRDKLIVTIDGADTRDIDDAISLEKTKNGYLLGVHIADVSHYVAPRSHLDNEAFSRGTSVYFPDRVLPMLPRALSNGICSLNEKEERLTLSCLMEIDDKGAVKKSEIVESVICSKHKMTYAEVSAILDGDQAVRDKYQNVCEMIELCAELTHILQERRAKKGSISLDVKEAKILFDENTGEITIPDYERAFSYQIIEAFMVLANETVAQFMQSIEAPFIYRVHEKPTGEKAAALRAFAQSLGLTPRFQADDVKPYDYRNLLKSAENLPSYSVLNRVMLRSMQKARYAAENKGHFGLASDCYCHFTSPIRRYPDLCIHRIIKEVLHGNYDLAVEKYGEFATRAAQQSSDRERRATDAERDVDDLYKTMYMSERIGEEFEAVISGVTAHGLFAELPFAIEGFIPIESLFGNFTFDPDRLRLVGRTEIYAIGESVHVKVIDVDFYRRKTEFRLLGKKNKE